MKAVRHKHAGWVGIIADGRCFNGVIDFRLTRERREQLESIEISCREFEKILKKRGNRID